MPQSIDADVSVKSLDIDYFYLRLLYDRFASAFKSSKKTRCSRLLADIKHSLADHIQYEESMMLATGFSDFPNHKAFHASVIRSIDNCLHNCREKDDRNCKECWLTVSNLLCREIDIASADFQQFIKQ